MQSSKRQQKRCPVRCVQWRSGNRLGLFGGDEVRQIMCPVSRPALADDMIDNILRVADQMLAAFVILQIVITTKPPDLNIFAFRTELAGPVHPGQYDIRLEVAGFPAKCQTRPDIHRATEFDRANVTACNPQSLQTVTDRAYEDALFYIGTGDSTGHSHEKLFRPAELSTGHGLHQSHRFLRIQGSSCSNRAAASGQPQRRCLASDACCWRRQRASSVRILIAASAKPASSPRI